MKGLLTDQQVSQFDAEGFLILRDFYPANTIESVRAAIYYIVSLVIEKRGTSKPRSPYESENFDVDFMDLISIDRSAGGEVYDAIKQIPAFVRLCCSVEHDYFMRQLRGTQLPGIALGGNGIRIDVPNEERFRARWHQDYPAQFRSLDGLVFWSPLLSMTKELGPVELCVGSHKEGIVRVHKYDSNNPDKTGAYGLVLENEQEVVDKYERVAPLLSPSDLLIIDFLTVHRSGTNVGHRPRWSMQMRYFNFLEPSGINHGWAGSFAAGTAVETVHPDIFIN